MGNCCANNKLKRAPTFKGAVKESYISHRAILGKIGNTYTFTKVLGKGHFGVVREAKKKNSKSQLLFAVKSIEKAKVEKHMPKLHRELDILSELDHPNIIKLYEVYEDKKYIHIVTDCCYGGDLFENIVESGQYTEHKAAKVMKKLLRAIAHIHNSNIVHRDIKPENILFVDKGPESDLKIIDLGLSKKFDDTKELRSKVGTPYYVSPEVLRGVYGTECDIWALGVMLYIMLCGNPPFDGNTEKQVYHKICHEAVKFEGVEWGEISTEAKALIRKLLIKDPRQRATVQEAMDHPWFKNQNVRQKRHKTRLASAVNHMIQYSAPNRLRSEAMKIVTKFINEDNIKELREVFHTLDSTNSGFITCSDVKRAVSNLGYKHEADEIAKIVNEVDYLSQGKINYSEFLLATLNFKEQLSDQLLFDTFQHFDVSNKGHITEEEFIQGFMRTGNYENDFPIRTIVEGYNFEDRMKIKFKEFKAIMLQECSSPDKKKKEGEVMTPFPEKMTFGQKLDDMLTPHPKKVPMTFSQAIDEIEVHFAEDEDN